MRELIALFALAAIYALRELEAVAGLLLGLPLLACVAAMLLIRTGRNPHTTDSPDRPASPGRRSVCTRRMERHRMHRMNLPLWGLLAVVAAVAQVRPAEAYDTVWFEDEDGNTFLVDSGYISSETEVMPDHLYFDFANDEWWYCRGTYATNSVYSDLTDTDGIYCLAPFPPCQWDDMSAATGGFDIPDWTGSNAGNDLVDPRLFLEFHPPDWDDWADPTNSSPCVYLAAAHRLPIGRFFGVVDPTPWASDYPPFGTCGTGYATWPTYDDTLGDFTLELVPGVIVSLDGGDGVCVELDDFDVFTASDLPDEDDFDITWMLTVPGWADGKTRYLRERQYDEHGFPIVIANTAAACQRCEPEYRIFVNCGAPSECEDPDDIYLVFRTDADPHPDDPNPTAAEAAWAALSANDVIWMPISLHPERNCFKYLADFDAHEIPAGVLNNVTWKEAWIPPADWHFEDCASCDPGYFLAPLCRDAGKERTQKRWFVFPTDIFYPTGCANIDIQPSIFCYDDVAYYQPPTNWSACAHLIVDAKVDFTGYSASSLKESTCTAPAFDDLLLWNETCGDGCGP